MRRVVLLADKIGIRAIEVDAIDDSATRFYVKYGFRNLMDDTRHLYIPMHEVRKLKLRPNWCIGGESDIDVNVFVFGWTHLPKRCCGSLLSTERLRIA